MHKDSRCSIHASRALVLGIALGFLLVACGKPPAPPETPHAVLVTRPSGVPGGGPAFAGEVRAREESPLSFRVGGKLIERRVDIGDHVAEGDVLAVLDAGDLQAQARAAQAQLASAQAELGRARADRARFAALAQDQLVSRSALDAQNAAAAAAQGQVNAAQASLEVARNQAAYARLRAPADGVIAGRAIEAGQVVAAGQTVLTLAADGSREVVFAIPEGAIGTIRPGQPAQVSTWANPERRWPGRIREISPAADPASRTFAARVSIDAPDDALRLGQSARVHLQDNGRAQTSVPLAALQRSGDAASVFVVNPETSALEMRPIKVGGYAQDQVRVVSGLAGSDWVVAAGGHLLRAGQKVTPVDRDNRPVQLSATKPAASE